MKKRFLAGVEVHVLFLSRFNFIRQGSRSFISVCFRFKQKRNLRIKFDSEIFFCLNWNDAEMKRWLQGLQEKFSDFKQTFENFVLLEFLSTA